MRVSYGVSFGPERVAFQLVMSVSEGKAEMPGVGDIIRVISSDWRLRRFVSIGMLLGCVVQCVPLDDVAVVRWPSRTIAFGGLVDGRHAGGRCAHRV